MANGSGSDPAPVSTAVPLIPPKMKVGFNYPWAFNKYGLNFGSDDPPIWKDTLPRNLALLQTLGVKVVRWFILANAANYGSVRKVAVFQSLAGGFFRFELTHPTSVDLFMKHFRLALQAFKDTAKEEGKAIQLIPCLLDFPVAADPGTGGGSGRGDLIGDPKHRDPFFNTILDGFLSIAAKEFKEQIFAFEVMNEPAWLVRTISQPLFKSVLPKGPRFPLATVREFLKLALDRINRAGLPSTVGHRFFSDFDEFGPDAVGTLRQFHYYAHTLPFSDPSALPTFSESNAFLGEFGSQHEGQFDSVHGKPWVKDCQGRDLTANDIVFERLAAAARKGYSLAMVWPELDNPPNDGLKVSANKLESIKRFTQGRFRNGIP